MERADIILLLVSPDFLASQYCYGSEVTRAMELHEQRKVRVIPVILRPCQWHEARFGEVLAAPKDGKPVTKHTDPDDAFLQTFPLSDVRDVMLGQGWESVTFASYYDLKRVVSSPEECSTVMVFAMMPGA
ncbi:MAG: hypothetical protein QOD51_263 [Candidatus Eremiobacteraeota bacterium]|jgi:hypothetical protein|nr:hypothetical protein [Candidatus Eremiobacteraeota bacterium]